MRLRIVPLSIAVAVFAWATIPATAVSQSVDTHAVCRSIERQHTEQVNKIRIPLGDEVTKARARISRAQVSETRAAEAIRTGCQRLAKNLWGKARSDYQRAQREVGGPRVAAESRRRGVQYTQQIATLKFDIQRAITELRKSQANLTRLHGSSRPRVGQCRTKDQKCSPGDSTCKAELEKLPICPR